ncbi:penicillin-insensitive murein endopeptidase [Enhygromyxa salina]|uniref:Penicillin-insensitive murein endopeptidase n=2 Tax=Enhygromyxa salina TaxID=215803 RepID=A0A2S9XUN1_9BACT|nr:penicillin-insensitive murein endopeptidase [Enhygromyxa salina]
MLELPAGADPNEYVQATWLPAIAAEPVEVPAWQRYWRGDQTEHLDRPRWIRHTTGPRETKADLAARYGTDAKMLRQWNPKTLARKRKFLREGVELRLKATRVPPPREPITYVAREGDTWESVAVDHRVDVRDLKSYNNAANADSLDELAPERELLVWVDPAIPWTVNRFPGPEIDPAWLDIPQGALSHGHPNRGRIKGEPCQLPEIPQLYTRRFDRIAHGSSHAIEVIVTAFANFRRDTGYAGEIFVGSISRPHGRRFPPHRSHQSGRDVDIRVPMLPWFNTMIDPPPEQIDWRATWALIDAFLATGEVSMIFLDHDLQRHLYYAAMSMGVSAEELDEIITWPLRSGTKGKKIVRHSKGHDGHIHVRMKCGDNEPGCRTRRPWRPPPK